MPTPTFEIKKVKNFMGSDCPGYNLDLWMDGKLIAHVINDGSGGDTNFTYVENGKEVFHSETQKRFEDYCKSLPALESEYSPEGLAMDAALFVDELLTKYDTEKKLKRAVQKHLVFKTTKNKKGEYMSSSRPYSLAEKSILVAKYPGAIVLNEIFPNGNWYETINRGPLA